MNVVPPRFPLHRWLLATALLAVLAGAAWWLFDNEQPFSRGQALTDAMRPLIENQHSDQSLVARAILDNYLEARSNAVRWSGVYWGFTFVAAVLSALAALVLKLETVVRNEEVKKDLAATFAVTAALLITISTSGDFQRKWQANRIAAAELEQTGYALLEKNTDNPRKYLAEVGRILMRRHLAIVGGTEPNKSENDTLKLPLTAD